MTFGAENKWPSPNCLGVGNLYLPISEMGLSRFRPGHACFKWIISTFPFQAKWKTFRSPMRFVSLGRIIVISYFKKMGISQIPIRVCELFDCSRSTPSASLAGSSANIKFDELDIPRALSTYPPSLAGIAGCVRPTQAMVNMIRKEIAEASNKDPLFAFRCAKSFHCSLDAGYR